MVCFLQKWPRWGSRQLAKKLKYTILMHSNNCMHALRAYESNTAGLSDEPMKLWQLPRQQWSLKHGEIEKGLYCIRALSLSPKKETTTLRCRLRVFAQRKSDENISKTRNTNHFFFCFTRNDDLRYKHVIGIHWPVGCDGLALFFKYSLTSWFLWLSARLLLTSRSSRSQLGL